MSGPKQDRAIRTRATLVRAAAEVFAEQGFAGATVTKITQRAGVTLGAMYFHFASKEALAREIVTTQPERVAPPHESTGLQRAVDVTLTWAHQLRTDPILLAGARLVQDQEAFTPPEDNSHQQWTNIIQNELETAQKHGELNKNTETSKLARLIVYACTGAQMHAHIASEHQDLPTRVAETWQCLLPAITTPTTTHIDLTPQRGKTT